MSTDVLMTNVLTQIILEYRPSFETLKKIFRMSEKEINEKIMANPDYFIKAALIYVLYNETKKEGLVDQNESKKKIQRFLTELHCAKTSGEKMEVIKNLDTTSNMSKIRHKKYEDYTKEDIEKLLYYRYKYVLTRTQITDNFNITNAALRYHESLLEGNYSDRMKAVNAYYNFQKYGKTGKKSK
ncbi:MAG: hypothetical protein IJO32_07225 [Bacilli bacterium]|nr:hypothetical protein [Bacilli bacterium]